MRRRSRGRWLELALAMGLVGAGCGEDEPVVQQRGAPALPGGGTPATGDKSAKKTAPTRSAQTSSAAEETQDEEAPPRPPPVLDVKSFARARDPFLSPQMDSIIVPEVERPKAQRKVRMPQYRFEDLKLIAIVNSGRGVVPRALFLATDGKSGTIHQGEYFSSAEVLLAAVNRDYVEIEVVDDGVASGLGLERGERRAIYLRND
jgi:Tfp pilus assembly protein PilP